VIRPQRQDNPWYGFVFLQSILKGWQRRKRLASVVPSLRRFKASASGFCFQGFSGGGLAAAWLCFLLLCGN
jgi:hypothetical protein